MDVEDWLHGLGLGQYVPAFRDNAIDAALLPRLTGDDLKELGVAAVGHRRRLLDAIAALPAASPPAPAAPASSAGGPAAVEGERRQVTVLFADLTGFTALGHELDAEEVHRLLADFFAVVDGLVTDHGGRIDKHIGDCVMAVFGAPRAHGDDTFRAVRAALAIRNAMPELSRRLGRRLDVHIGVASGEVVASPTGSADHLEYTVTGDSVNLAARLTDLAAPGEVLLSDAVQRGLADRLDCASAGDLVVQGFTAPVRAWRLHGLSRRQDRPGALVGRAEERAQLAAVLRSCRDIGRGRSVLVRGEAGIGKTRLVEQTVETATELGFACHTSLVLDFGAGSGRGAVRTLVLSLLGLSGRAEGEAVERAAAAAVATGLVATADAVFLNDLLDLPQPSAARPRWEAMDNAQRSGGKRTTLARLIEELSRSRPLLLVVEDVHWADGPTLEHLARVARSAATCPALLVMTSRTEGDPLDATWRSRAGPGPLLTIDLGPLRHDEALALTRRFAAAPAAVVARCIARAGGNPLFLEQLLRHSEEQADALSVPGSVRSLVQERLDRLAPEDRQALQAAAVLGQRFDLELLRRLLQRPGYDPAGLVAAFLLRPLGEEFLFAHALIRDSVYDTLLKRRRRGLHLAAAALFAGRDPVLRATHLDRAEDPGAGAAYLEAVRAEITHHRFEAAQALARRGIELAREPGIRAALTCSLGEILHDLGDMAGARAAFTAALEEGDDEQCGRAWLGLAAVKRITDDLDGAFADLERAEAAAEAAGRTAELARIHFLRGNLHFPRGNIAGCLAEHGLSLELARAAGAPDLEAAALGGLGDAEYLRGRMRSAHDRLQDCLVLCRRHGLGRTLVANQGQLAHTLLYLGDQATALDAALAAVAAAIEVGHLRAELNARLAMMFARFELQDLDGTSAEAEAIGGLVERLNAPRFAQPRLLYLGLVACARGRRSEAVRLVEEAAELARRTGFGFHGPNILGALALALDDAGRRRAALEEGMRMLRAGTVGHNPLRFHPLAIDAALGAGDPAAAIRHADELAAFTAAEPLPWSELFAARGRALAEHALAPDAAGLRDRLVLLRAEAERLGLRRAIPAIETALARRRAPDR